MHRRFILWFVSLFFTASAIIVGGTFVAPDLLDGYGIAARLILGLAVLGLCGIAVDAILQVRAGGRVITSFLPLAIIVLIFGVTFPTEIVALAQSLASRNSPEIRCAPGEDGRYRPQLVISGQPVTFVLDTSVDDIVLTADDAKRIGIDVAALTFDDEALVGNVRSVVATVELDDVQFGSFAITDLPAKISKNALGGNVLGMEFLDRFNRWRVENGELILEP